jgi:hypothetical protein
MPVVVTTGRFYTTEAEYDAAVASLEARAALAEANGLRSTARSWRDRAANLPRPTSSALPFTFVFVSTRIICAMFAEDPVDR